MSQQTVSEINSKYYCVVTPHRADVTPAQLEFPQDPVTRDEHGDIDVAKIYGQPPALLVSDSMNF